MTSSRLSHRASDGEHADRGVGTRPAADGRGRRSPAARVAEVSRATTLILRPPIGLSVDMPASSRVSAPLVSGLARRGCDLCSSCEVTPCGEAGARPTYGTIRAMSRPTRLRPAHRTFARPHARRCWWSSVAVICAVEVGVGWLITHPLKSTMAHENSLNRWFADQRTLGPDSPGRPRHAPRGDPDRRGRPGRARVVFAVWQRSLWPVLFVLALDGGIGLFYLASTTLDPRNRPPVHILQSGLVPDHSFPSGHTGTATGDRRRGRAPALGLHPRVPRAVIALSSVIPVWTMLARLYEGAHHLSDVLVALVVTLVWLTRVRPAAATLEGAGPLIDFGSSAPRYDAEQRRPGPRARPRAGHAPGGPADDHREDQRRRARDQQRRSAAITTWLRTCPTSTTRSLTWSPKTRRCSMIGVRLRPTAMPASTTSPR